MLHSNKNINKEELKKYYMEHFQWGDVIIGTVYKLDRNGCSVIDDKSGKEVFYYGNNMIGDRVELKIIRIDLEKVRITCDLSSVLEYADFVA